MKTEFENKLMNDLLEVEKICDDLYEENKLLRGNIKLYRLLWIVVVVAIVIILINRQV